MNLHAVCMGSDPSPMLCRKHRAGVDIHSCSQFLLELYSRWILPSSSARRTPVILISEVVRSVSFSHPSPHELTHRARTGVHLYTHTHTPFPHAHTQGSYRYLCVHTHTVPSCAHTQGSDRYTCVHTDTHTLSPHVHTQGLYRYTRVHTHTPHRVRRLRESVKELLETWDYNSISPVEEELSTHPVHGGLRLSPAPWACQEHVPLLQVL